MKRLIADLKVLLLPVVIGLMLPGDHLTAQDTGGPGESGEPTEDPVEKELTPIESSLQSLAALLESIQAKNAEIQKLDDEINATELDVQKAPLQEESRRLQQELLDLEAQFETVAGAGAHVDSFKDAESEPVDLEGELAKLLQPIIDEAKKATESPREIERLRGEVLKYSERKALADQAVAQLELLVQTEFASEVVAPGIASDLKERLGQSLESWKARQKEAANQVTVNTNQLEVELKNQQPFIDATQDMVLRFFRSRGVNLLLGLASFVLVYALLRFVYRQGQRIAIVSRGGRTFGGRLVDVLYQIFVLVAALMSMVVVFYLTNDLVLLGLTMLFIAGLSWGGIKFLPGYLEQVRLMLNLGPAKEKERMIMDGIPWMIDTLKFQCVLVNPALDGGVLRLPVKSLVGHYSRPCVDEESWFPSQTGEWVRLEDGVCGKVLWQTMEMVCIEPLGKARLTYQTQKYLGLNPQNLSGGFRVSATFAIDHRHQAESTTTIPGLMKESLHHGLSKFIDDSHLRGIEVEITEAGMSAITYQIDVDVSGEAAPQYDRLQRTVTGILIDACNANRWTIPFNQIRIHQTDIG